MADNTESSQTGDDPEACRHGLVTDVLDSDPPRSRQSAAEAAEASRWPRSEQDRTPQMYVLEAVDTTPSVLRRTPTVILCPGCGDPITEYPEGLPAYVSHFKRRCDTCEVALRRWAVVAIDAAYADTVPHEPVATLVQAYWERHLWQGIQTSGEYPRTEEFTEAYQRLARHFDWGWELSCPLCRRAMSAIPQDRLEYHHWTRGADDQGICLCRECHDYLSNGNYDNQVDWRARELGLRGKDDLQIARLANRETTHQDYDDHDDYQRLADILVSRYNLPYDSGAVRCILQQVLGDDGLRDALDATDAAGGECGD